MEKEQKHSLKILTSLMLVFAIVLSLSLFTACGKNPPDNGGDDDTPESSSPEPNIAGLFNPVTGEQTYTWEQLIEDNYIIVEGNTVSKGSNYNRQSLFGKLVVSNQITTIAENTFEYWVNISHVVIPDGITTIGANAFDGCYNLIGAIIPSTVTDIGNRSFWGCTKLVEIYNLSEKNLYGTYDQAYTDHVYTSLSEPSKISITNSGWVYYTKDDDRKLLGYVGNETEITLPSDITEIYQFAFNRSPITKVTIPANITKIGIRAFDRALNLTEINFKATSCDDFEYNNPVFDSAGKDSTGITLNIDANVTRVPAYLLNRGNNGTSEPNVKTVNFGTSSQIISIRDRAFCCNNIETVNFNNRPVALEDGGAFSNASITSISIPNGSTMIGSYAFSSCSKLTSVTIPEGVTKIGSSAFSQCSKLTSISIPEGVTEIGNSAFWWCSELTNITIPESVTFIGINAFKNCTSLYSITFAGSGSWIVSTKADKSGNLISVTNTALLYSNYAGSYYWFKKQN